MSDIQELPKTLEEYKKLMETIGFDFEVIQNGPADPFYQPGMIHRTWRIVRCPFCKNEFSQKVHTGCFSSRKEPFLCPKCHFPENLLNHHMRLLEKQREREVSRK